MISGEKDGEKACLQKKLPFVNGQLCAEPVLHVQRELYHLLTALMLSRQELRTLITDLKKKNPRQRTWVGSSLD